ncbi:MAG: hypothetical protein HY243_15670 [Proteobacteria bacterium]|nr:hypothetical protein [Pseudomonadota bacterium]
MIVWSRGLGRLRLPLVLPAATLRVTSHELTMEGVIEPVCWNYAIRLSPADLTDFLTIMAKPQTARFLAERGGLLLPFVFNLLRRIPGVVVTFLFRKRAGAQSGEVGSIAVARGRSPLDGAAIKKSGDQDALLV